MNADGAARLPRRRPWLRESARALVGLLLFAGLAFLVREHFDLAQGWLERLDTWAPPTFVAVHVVVVSLGFPVSVLGFLAGATFGVWTGTLVLLAADLLAATLMFVVARWLFFARVRRFAASRPRLTRFLDLAEDDAMRVMVLLRLSPLHYGLVCYLLGASRVRFLPFLLTSLLVLPSAVLQVYMGHAVVRLGQRTAGEGGLVSWESALAIVGVIAALLLLGVIGQMARRALRLDEENDLNARARERG
jgi:uncharacterized membrane protein YdjX (TVP38/TMEM64 family)